MNYSQLERVIDVVNQLRDPKNGCPWDLKQTHETLLQYLIEESYEFIDATQKQDSKLMEEEIGDVLLQVLLHCRLADERGDFNIESVSKHLADKLIRRHPHVFDNPNKKAHSIEEIKTAWQKSKTKEGKTQHTTISKKDNLYPALFSANVIGKKTSELNFDWENYQQVLFKVEEEWQELKEELSPHKSVNSQKVEEELGDLLFSVAQLARHLKLNPEEVLHKANNKFIKRFNTLEQFITSDGKNILELSNQQLEDYWLKAKKSK